MAENKAAPIVLLGAAWAWAASSRELAIVSLRLALALVLLCLLPGFLMLRLFFPSQRLNFEFWFLSLAMSFAILPLIGLVLHPFNALTLQGWIAATSLLCLVAWFYLLRQPDARTASAIHDLDVEEANDERSLLRSPKGLLNVGRIVRFGSVALAIVMAIGIARYGAFNHRQFAYTELWMLPSQRNNFQRLTIGVTNQEKQPLSYDLELSLNGKLIQRRSNLIVRNGGTWIEEATAPIDKTGTEQIVEAKLYRTDQPSLLYRHTLLKFVAEGVR